MLPVSPMGLSGASHFFLFFLCVLYSNQKGNEQMKMTVIVEVDVQPFIIRTGKGLDYTDTTLPMTEEEVREMIKTYFNMSNADRCQISGHPISFWLKSIL